MARQMKDSGVEWIGEIPAEWRVGRIKDFAQLQTGATPSTSCPHYFNGEIPWFTPGDFSESFEVTVSQRTLSKQAEDEKQAVILPPQTPLLVGIGASAGKVSFSQVKCSCNQQVTALIECSANPKLLTYILEAGRVYLRDTVAFTTLPIINNQTLGYFKIAVPTCVAEQQEIAAILDTKCAEIDKVVEQTRATIEEYKKLKQAIITEAVTKGVSGSRPMKPSGVEWIGDIPEDWSMKRFKYLGTYRNGLTYKPEDMVDTGTLVLRSSNIQNGQIVLDDNVYVGCTVRDELKVHKGDILICSRNGSRELIGKNAIITEDMDASFGAFMMIFRSDTPKYVRYILNSSVFSYYLASFFTATINQLTASNFGNMKVPFCCDLTEQQEIVTYLDAKCAEIDRIIEKKEQLIEELGSYKKSLIYKYVTGKKEVKTNMELKVPYSN